MNNILSLCAFSFLCCTSLFSFLFILLSISREKMKDRIAQDIESAVYFPVADVERQLYDFDQAERDFRESKNKDAVIHSVRWLAIPKQKDPILYADQPAVTIPIFVITNHGVRYFFNYWRN